MINNNTELEQIISSINTKLDFLTEKVKELDDRIFEMNKSIITFATKSEYYNGEMKEIDNMGKKVTELNTKSNKYFEDFEILQKEVDQLKTNVIGGKVIISMSKFLIIIGLQVATALIAFLK